MIDYENGALGDPGIPEPEIHERPWEKITWPVKGVVVNVTPPDSTRNGQGQLLCDVKLVDDGYTLFNLAVLSPGFHQDTDPEGLLARQTIAPRSRGIYDGESFSPAVGSIVLVQFIGAPGANRDAVIIGFFPVSMQSLPHGDRKQKDNLFPREAQAVTIFDEGVTKEEYRARLQPSESETPRWTRIQNGTAVEIDNRGNFNVQTTINKEKIKKERYSNFDYSTPEIKETPEPEGNAVISTRGARKGNIGLVTGELKVTELKKSLTIMEDGERRTVDLTLREAVDEKNEEGNILVSTIGAGIGNETHNIQKDEAHNVLGDCSLNVGGRVSLGASLAVEPAVLGNSLLQWIVTILMTHVHYGVKSGNSTTGLPTIVPPDAFSQVTFISRTAGGGSSADSDLPNTPGSSESGNTNVQQSSANLAAALAAINVGNSNLDKMAIAIAQFEGFSQGSRSQRNNNPGNLVYRRQAGAIGKDAQGFAIFDTFEHGFDALKNQLTLSASGNTTLYSPNMTLVEFFKRYDPPGNPIGYADYVASSLGVTRDTKIGTILAG